MKVVKHPIPVIQPPSTYDLTELTLEEALIIRSLTGKVLGNGPLRKAADSIYYTLGKIPEIQSENTSIWLDGYLTLVKKD